jgi:multidrug efflux pump subunit AcrA (membrane-fusion protein)
VSARRTVARPLALVVAGLAGLTACSGDEPEPITTAAVALGDVQEVVEAPANVAARASVTLVAPASGRIDALEVADGKSVRAGRVVLSIDSPQADEQLRQARAADAQAAASGSITIPGLPVSESAERADERAREAFEAARDAAADIEDEDARARALAALARAEADYAAARVDAERAVRRFNAGLGSLGQAVSSLGQAQRVQTRAAVEVAEQTVAALVIRSPITGVVSLGTAGGSGSAPDLSGLAGLADSLPDEVAGAGAALGAASSGGSGGVLATVAEGSAVTAGQTLATVTDVSELSLVAEVDETDVLLVEPGTPASVELDALPGATYDAEVTSVDVAPSASARGGVAYRVRLSLGGGTDADGEPAPQPRPGMSAVARLTVRDVADAPVVPTSAVVRADGRDAVWLVTDGVARRRFVEVGAQGEATVQVLSGVAVGDEVVVGGADQVSDGQRLDDGG